MANTLFPNPIKDCETTLEKNGRWAYKECECWDGSTITKGNTKQGIPAGGSCPTKYWYDDYPWRNTCSKDSDCTTDAKKCGHIRYPSDATRQGCCKNGSSYSWGVLYGFVLMVQAVINVNGTLNVNQIIVNLESVHNKPECRFVVVTPLTYFCNDAFRRVVHNQFGVCYNLQNGSFLSHVFSEQHVNFSVRAARHLMRFFGSAAMLGLFASNHTGEVPHDHCGYARRARPGLGES